MSRAGGGGRWQGGSSGKGKNWGKKASGGNCSDGNRSNNAGNTFQKKPCFAFQRGSCKFGSNCKFRHDTGSTGSSSGGPGGSGGNRSNNPGNTFQKKPCFTFQQQGSCKFGSNCKFRHDTGSANSSTGGPGGENNVRGPTGGQGGGAASRNAQDSSRLIKQLKNTQLNQLADVITRAGHLWAQCWGDASSKQMSVDAVEILVQTLAKVPFSQEAKVPPPPIHALSSAMKRYLTSSAVDPLLGAETALNVVRKALCFEWEEKKPVVKGALGQILEDAANKLQRRQPDHRDCMQRIDEVLDKLEKPWSIKEKNRGLSLSPGERDGELEDGTQPGGVPHHHHSNWRNATVGWLVHAPTFSPSDLPKMQGPSTKSRGVYKDRDHYFDTMSRLMVAMAFSEGHSSLAPKCWERGGGGGHSCGSTLARLPDGQESGSGGTKAGSKKGSSGPSRCRGRGCPNPPVLLCKFDSHSRGLCQRCADNETGQLLGPTGSTHVYNSHVARIDGGSGKLYLSNFFSRKAQLDENGKPRPIHWRSTKRLAVPNLVGIVRLGAASSVPPEGNGKASFYRSLEVNDRIHWGEVSYHGNPRDEDKQRQQGHVCVNLASPSIFEPDNAPDIEHEFRDADVVAIIDCMSFVPEYMPVIRAYEKQEDEFLPFNDGLLLNLDVNCPADLTNTVLGADAQNKAAAEGDFQKCIFERFGYGSLNGDDSSEGDDSSGEENSGSEPKGKAESTKRSPSTVTTLPKHLVQKLVAEMVESSTILPLREIRQNSDISAQMQTELVDLLLKATLDFGQLVNFIDSLRNPVHCTQGPPGTGKSYLGVQLVHALAVIRKYWIQQNKSVGTPPILVLSYKNHATDEFLVDLLKVMGTSLTGSGRRNYYGGQSAAQLVRMGNPGDSLLDPYSERQLAQKSGGDVRARQSDVHELQDLRRACQRAQRSATLSQSYQADMFDTALTALGTEGLSPDAIRKRQNDAAYEATEVMFAAIVRSLLLQTFSSTQQLQSLSSIMNRDAPEDEKFTLLQQHGLRYQNEVRETLATLFQGIQHYVELDASYGDPYELLYMFLSGQHPKPSCVYKEVDHGSEGWSVVNQKNEYGQVHQCGQIADWHEVPLCRDHRCVLPGMGEDRTRCSNPIYNSWNSMLCKEHMCWHDQCDQPRIRIGEQFVDGTGALAPVVEKYCRSHACFQCVKLNVSPALEALDEPRRNTCELHPLCSVMDCLELAAGGEDYCEEHAWKQCEFRNIRGDQCTQWAISSDMPCCYRHVDWLKEKTLERLERERAYADIVDDDKGDSELAAAVKVNSEKRQCMGVNRKKKPCKGFAMVGCNFCEAHAPKDAGFKAKQTEREAEFRRLKEKAEREKKTAQEQTKLKSAVDRKADSQESSSTDDSNSSSASRSSASSNSENEDGGLVYGPPPDLDDVDLARLDNMDEADEGEGATHMREVFDVESGDDEEGEEDDDEFHDAAFELLPQSGTLRTGGQLQASKVPVKDPKDWSWSMSLDDRWAACQAFMHYQCEKLVELQTIVKSELPLARKRLREAESRARAQVFENKTVIGGTIVGCITRLEAIRATRPFAIVVEEASEVMELLLFACLCQSTVKLQLIGDHLQLQPSLMDKFDFTRINKVNVSLFERLICAPDSHRVPSGVLSVQRRMRRDVCDLTRDYYKDIVEIEDHPVCSTKTLPGQDALSSFWVGREVPGVRSHLYLWTHSGAQGRASVGISKENKHEAQMAVNLAYYLVKCGVMKQSIAILTPYKGQLMLIRKLLLTDQSNSRLLSRDPTAPNQVRLSTVDRFQGDEADVVIASLVVDEKSRTQFVKLQNRMIVLLSRARLGCFILGNIGYFNQAGGAKHWMKTFAILESPPVTSDNSDTPIVVDASAVPGTNSDAALASFDDVTSTDARTMSLTDARFEEARVGPSLPLCCPQHPLLSRVDAKDAKDLDLGFCQVICTEKLLCSHECGLKCHFPDKRHNKKCKVLVDSPCHKHPEQLQCASVYKSTTASKQDPIDNALEQFQCPKKVDVTLPCSHEEEMECWQEDEIALGKKSFPKCHRQSLTPYVYPDCGHKLNLTCSKLEQYTKNESLVKKCTEMVEYHPSDCTHTQMIKCYLDKEYRAGKSIFVCPKKLTVALPRCGHEANHVTCSENAIKLERWTGRSADEVGIVLEGVQYGPKDYGCKHPSKFLRHCGHEETTTCNKAFEMAAMADLNDKHPCRVRVPVTHPHCGHRFDVSCADAEQIEEVEKLTPVPVDEVHQGAGPPFPDNLPRGIGRCKEKVTLHRLCGHTHEVACGAARGTVALCKEEVTVCSPLCGHQIKVPCWRRKAVEAWSPWNEHSADSLVTNGTLPFDAKLNEGSAWPDDDVLALLRGCPGTVVVSKECGHTYKESCGEIVSIIRNGGKSKKGASCTESVTRALPHCGHEVTVLCKEWQLFTENRTEIQCSAMVERQCWNVAICRNTVSVSCADASKGTSSICCQQSLEWECKSGRHTQMLQLCMDGPPDTCPLCLTDDISQFIETVQQNGEEFSLPHVVAHGSNNRKTPGSANLLSTLFGAQRQTSVEECLLNVESTELDTEAQGKKFFSALAQGLGKIQRFSMTGANGPKLSPAIVPVFFVLASTKKKRNLQQDGFIRTTNFVNSASLSGIAVHALTRDNMRSLANESKGSTKQTLLIGYLCMLNPKEGCDWPTAGKKAKQESVRKWRDGEGRDCVAFKPKKGKLLEQIVVWDPAALYATHRVGPLDAQEIEQFAEDIGAIPGPRQDLQPTSNAKGTPKDVIVGEIVSTALEEEHSAPGHDRRSPTSHASENVTTAFSMKGSWGECLRFVRFEGPSGEEEDDLPLCLHEYSSQMTQEAVAVSVENDLMQKLRLLNDQNENPFGGKKLLERQVKAHKKRFSKDEDPRQVVPTIYQLLLSLEISKLGDDERAMGELEEYCSGLLAADLPAHPILLLAFYRIGLPVLPTSRSGTKLPDNAKLLRDFARFAPGMQQMVLSEDEHGELGKLSRDPSALADGEIGGKVASPADLWEEMKETHSFRSDAMEKLMKMTGLRRVKQRAVELFKQGLVFSRMDDETRKRNIASMNYVFLGNPGVGKTTVARHFAEILHDSGLRTNNNFIETSGQDLKDGGVDDFNENVNGAMDGVLFIDEAYTLDPVGDKFKGGPVANELLSVAENERDKISFILAGYEDEINDKLFAFNPGFKSRFTEVHFDDFDEDELVTIWTSQREDRMWREADDRLGRVVIRRLAKLRGRKGFGNARLVRQKLEEACSRAMAREDFDSQDLELRIEDAIGENPLHNEKLQAVVAEFDARTGWIQVKEQVRNLVNVCGQNYERELQGQEQLPVQLNRLFLGNPGTGKTTSARLYGKLLKALGFLSKGEVVEKTAGDLGGQVVGESKQKTVALIENCRGKVLMIDEAYGLNDSLYGKQALDAVVEKVQGTEADDIAVLLLGYEEQMMEMMDNQNPGLRRRFAADQAFRFEDYNPSQLEKILSDCCKAKIYKPTLEFREKALKKLEMQRRSEPHFGNAGSVQNLLKSAVAQATSKRKCSPDGALKLEADDIELPGDDADDSDFFAELDNLYRMESVKGELAKIKSQFDLADDEGEERPKLGHLAFTGAPGTGKTTVARCLGKMLYRCGLVARPDVLETSGLKLTGEHVGSTKKIVEDHLDKAKGGVLFIDEAYELGRGAFGSEACSALVEAMTNDEKYGGMVIIMAGYQADMQAMLDTNQGLKSRIKRFIEFPDWHPSDCTEFFQAKAQRNNVTIEHLEDSIAIVEKGFKKLLPLKGWGNARDVTKFYESVQENRAQRLSAERASGGSPSLEKIFLKEDIATAMDAMVGARMGSGGAPRRVDPNADPFSELDKLYRMEKVKSKLKQLQNTYAVAIDDGEDPPPIGHFTFTGSPGTGKTTVARVMADILFDLELTTRKHVEETSGLKLQGQYMGQTKKIVEENLDKAKGGVLFIDEAYTLGQGSYGSEACDTLVAAMTDPQYAGVVVVIAGYPKDIDDMLSSNAGLKSRFTHTLEFPDWEVADCVQCFTERAKLEGFELADAAGEILQGGFSTMHSLEGFGNARDVDAVWKATKRYRADRLMRSNAAGKQFEESDLQQAVDELIKGRSLAKGKKSMVKRALMDEVLQMPPEQEDPSLKIKDAPMKVQTKEKVEEAVAEEVEQETEKVAEEATGYDEGRDPGVSDETWAELQMAKEAEAKHREQCLAEEAERKRIEEEMEAQMRAEQLAKEEYEEKMRELERQRELEAERKRQKEKILQKLRAIGNCPMGFQWHKCGSGWRCGGGSHYVSDAELNRSFGHDVA